MLTKKVVRVVGLPASFVLAGCTVGESLETDVAADAASTPAETEAYYWSCMECLSDCEDYRQSCEDFDCPGLCECTPGESCHACLAWCWEHIAISCGDGYDECTDGCGFICSIVSF